jgi:hypothetical protein
MTEAANARGLFAWRGSSAQLHTLRSQEDWEWLLEDMLKLSRTNDNGLRSAFGLLSQADILSIFLSGLLSTGRKCSLTLLF